MKNSYASALIYFSVGVAAMTASLGANAQEQASQKTLQNQMGTTIVDIKLKGYVFGLRVMEADYNTLYTDTSYLSQAMLRTSGLGAFLKKFKIWALSTGEFVGDDLRPTAHIQQNLNTQHRRVQMTYGTDTVDVNIVPPLGSQGMPPANPQERFESDDTLSALLNLLMRGFKTSAKPCNGTVAVFDSKQHYNLRMEHKGTKNIREKIYKGEVIKCHVFYEAVSGFDDDDLPSAKEAAAPIVLHLAKFEQAGLYIPIKMSYKISGFKAVIKAQYIQIQNGKHIQITPKPYTSMKELSAVSNPYSDNN